MTYTKLNLSAYPVGRMHLAVFSWVHPFLRSRSELSTAHKHFRVRWCLIKIYDEAPVWVTISYIPVIPALQQRAGEARARQCRSDIIQRVVYAALPSAIGSSHGGVAIYDPVNERTLTAFPRVHAYHCDHPEQRAVLCLKQGQYANLCTCCMVDVEDAGSSNAEERDAFEELKSQWHAIKNRPRDRDCALMLDLQAKHSLNESMRALACSAGLSTAPF